jgi:hypothetical protein
MVRKLLVEASRSHSKSRVASYHSNIDSKDAKRLSVGSQDGTRGHRRVDLWLLQGHCRSKKVVIPLSVALLLPWNAIEQ